MILQALYEYYQKHQVDLPPPGFSEEELHYLIVLQEDGTFDYLESLITDAKEKTGQQFWVPRRENKTNNILPNLLWDQSDYVLGNPPSKKEGKDVKDQAKKQAFIRKIESLPEDVKQTPQIHAVLEFYRRGEETNVFASPEWESCAKIPGCNLSFRLRNEIKPVFASPAFRAYVAAAALETPASDVPSGCCLVTGAHAPLCRLMSATPIPGGKAKAALVSFQISSGYDSYGKKQCYNAPISQSAEFACTTALKALLSKESKNKFSLGDTTAVFWVERDLVEISFESLIPALAQNPKDGNVENVSAMRKLCEAVYSGKLPAEDTSIRYYFLGLAPNAARISVRFWKTGTVGELAVNIAQHFRDLTISGGQEYLALSSLLAGVGHEYKMENVPPNLTGRMFEAIFNGTPYPDTWRNLCLQRIHADGKVSPLRAAVLKAYVNRKNRVQHTTNINKEIAMNYDPENPNVAYQCGALFALLVKAQEEANPGLNATISDRYFASASTRPATVFGTLLKLNNAHLKKLDPGRRIKFEQMMSEIIAKLGTQFPTYLPPDDQGRFCLGYYQKRQELFTAKKDNNEQTDTQN